MVCPQYRPLIGGYERAAERLATVLARRGHEVQVVTERRDPGWPAVEDVDGVRIERVWCLPRPGLHVPTVLLSVALFLLRRGRRFDIVHVHQYGWLAGLCVLFGALVRTPIVLKTTGTGRFGIASVIGRQKLAGPLRALHRRVDACITTSEEAAAEAAKLGIPAARIQRIPNGVDTDRFAPATAEERAAAKSELGLESGPLALYVGRLSPEKAPLVLLEAWSQASLRGVAQLAVVGEGPELEAARERAAAVPGVRIVGRVEDPLAWYRAADVYVLPSLDEGLSNSLLEALCCGLPVVATRISGSADVFREADVGTLVDVGDTEGLASALAGLLADPEARQRCAAAARELALRRYSLDQVATDVEKLYATLDAVHKAPR
jgi:glycosyltransferase involved in cell wall biosynthesis